MNSNTENNRLKSNSYRIRLNPLVRDLSIINILIIILTLLMLDIWKDTLIPLDSANHKKSNLTCSNTLIGKSNSVPVWLVLTLSASSNQHPSYCQLSEFEYFLQNFLSVFNPFLNVLWMMLKLVIHCHSRSFAIVEISVEMMKIMTNNKSAKDEFLLMLFIIWFKTSDATQRLIKL